MRETTPRIGQEEILKIIQIYFKNEKTDNCVQIKGALANVPYENIWIMATIQNKTSKS